MKFEHIYHIKLEYTSGKSDPSKIFSAYSNVINSFKKMDMVLGKTLNQYTKCEQTLEEIQLSSISSKIKQSWEYPDDELVNQNEKVIQKEIEDYVAYGTATVLEAINSNEKINSLNQIENVCEKINSKARNSSVGNIFSYTPPPNIEIINIIKSMSDSIQALTEYETLEYKTGVTTTKIPKKIEISVQDIETEMIKKMETNQHEINLKIKDLHFLSDAKWGFKHGKNNIEAKIEDSKWYNDFYIEKTITLHPGDSLKVIIEIREEFDKFGKLIKKENTIIEVKEVIQGSLDDE